MLRTTIRVTADPSPGAPRHPLPLAEGTTLQEGRNLQENNPFPAPSGLREGQKIYRKTIISFEGDAQITRETALSLEERGETYINNPLA